MTGDPRRWPNDQWAVGTVHFFGPFLYRSEFHASSEAEECERALEHLEHTVQMEGPATIAAIVLETVPGTAGIMPPPPGYLPGVREICDRNGIVLVLDEVMAGFGRTGAWFAFDHYDVRPDLIAFAKGVNSGYVPLGGVVISDEIFDTFRERVYPGGLTYSGHPLACAAAVATIEAMREDRIVDNARRIGDDVLGPGLRELAARHRCVGEVRGLGVFWALDLVKDRATKEPLAPYGGSSPAMGALTAACKERGLLPFTNYHRLHVVPPCTVSEAEAKEGMAILDEALGVADDYYTGSA
jgi:taurine---2-oxoglutarate transaminase